MRSRFLAAIAASLAVVPAAAAPVVLSQPTEGYTYFNRSAATWAELATELTSCASLADGANVVWNGGARPYVGLLPGMMQSGQVAGARAANLENCMVVRGWRVVKLPGAEGAALAKLDKETLAGKLRAWVGAEEPNGTITRVWGNEAGISAIVKQGMPTMLSRRSLSELALDIPTPELPFYDPKFVASAQIHRPKALSPAELAAVRPGDKAVIVLTLVAPNPQSVARLQAAERGLGGFGLTLASGDWETWRRDGRIQVEQVALDVFDRRRSENPVVRTEAFLVTPGRWLFSLRTLKLCMGAPFIEVKPGEVVYAGAFDLGSSRLAPDISLSPAQAHLASTPDLAARLKPAMWTNGHVSSCAGPYTLIPVYALEFPGAPLAKGYRPAGQPPQRFATPASGGR
jgi:hypothetical protein